MGSLRGRASGFVALVVGLLFIAAVACQPLPIGPGPFGRGPGDWRFPNGDLGNTRDASRSPITSRDVDRLEVAWSAPLPGPGTFGNASTTPIVVGGAVYLEDLSGNVRKFDLATGALIWSRDQSDHGKPMIGPNGVAVDHGKVFAVSGRGDIVALDARTGAVVWRSTVVGTATLGIDIQPTTYRGKVYAATVPVSLNGVYHGGDAGLLFALDERDGTTAWTFDTVLGDLWGNPTLNSGGGAWYPPAVDVQTGLIYWGTGNPAPFPGAPGFPSGSSRPGPDLYTSSTVALDAMTGKLAWYSQATPHDLFDLDHQLAMVVPSRRGNVVIGTGKDGWVYGLDPRSGRTLWKTSVGEHQNDTARDVTQPITVLPGDFGGVETPPAAANGVVYVPVLNEPTTYQPEAFGFQGTIGTMDGEVVAIDVATGKVRWDVKVPGDPLGGATVVGDLVFTGLQDGKILALSTHDGSTRWTYQGKGIINAWPAVVGSTIVWPLGGASPAQLLALRLPSRRPPSTVVGP
jgi:outer membrane protein assembly factor BamB